MVSDSELIARLREFLKESDLNTTTTAIVRRRLEEDFGIDLSEKKKFIREQIDLYLQSQFENAEEEEQEEEDENDDGDDQTAKIKPEESDDSDSNDEEESEKPRNRRAPAKKGSKRVNNEVKRRGGGGGGFNKVCSLSPQLQELVGVPALARTEVVRRIWAYIREKNLQAPDNKKNIICDEPLHALFGVHSIDMFQMNKALSKHILPLDSDEVVSVKPTEKDKQPKHEKEVKPMEKEKQPKHEREEDPKDSTRKEKRQKGFLAPLKLSDALVKFIGTGESVLTRADVIKRMWDYIKENNLQDPSDKRKVICDEKLKELFDVDNFTGFTVSKLLAAHFLKT